MRRETIPQIWFTLIMVLASPCLADLSENLSEKEIPAIWVGVQAGQNFSWLAATEGGGTPRLGFSVFGTFENRINNRHSVQVELGYVQKGAGSLSLDSSTVADIEFNYIELPTLYKYRAVQWKSVDIMYVIGPSIGLALDKSVIVSNVIDSSLSSRFAPIDFSLIAGMGVEFVEDNEYLFSLQLRFGLSLMDLDGSSRTSSSRLVQILLGVQGGL